MADPQDLVSIYRAGNVTEAYLVKNLLQDENIDAHVAEEFEPFAGAGFDPPEILIRKEDEARARPIIDAYEEQQIARGERPDWTCAKCGATVVGAFDECDVCGANRLGSEDEEEPEENA